MMQALSSPWITWAIAGLATAGVITRPFKWPEAIWAVGGAALIVLLGLLPIPDALRAVGEGLDVYLFLIGMMLLSELARREGVFDWVAAWAVHHAQGSQRRLFLLVYAVGTLTTVFLSNDATAVVLTPAVFAVAKRARAAPLPHLFVCAFIANAASFVLPISNPANLVLYGDHMPPLAAWMERFSLASISAVVVTYFALYITQRSALRAHCEHQSAMHPLSAQGRLVLSAIGVTAVALLLVSALDIRLGLPTALLGVTTMLALLIRSRQSPWPVIKAVSWDVLALVAGLFVLVQTLHHTGVIQQLASGTKWIVARFRNDASTILGTLIAVGSNVFNNLPTGLVASATIKADHLPQKVIDSLLIGVDIGPNLSVTGSLATILWLNAIRREGEHIGFWQFLKVGTCVMFPALVVALVARAWIG